MGGLLPGILMTDFLLAAVLLASVAGLALAAMTYFAGGKGAGLSREDVALLLRQETEMLRRAQDESARTLREEMATQIRGMQDSSLKVLEALRAMIDTKLAANATLQGEALAQSRQELADSLQRLGVSLRDSQRENLETLGTHQKERLDQVALAIGKQTETLETRLEGIRTENAKKLDEMRQTVDEKLQTTLDTRLGESFNRVVEQLNKVHEGLGEMKKLATNVGDLKSVLTNVKVRGTYGEVQLGMILEQFLTPDQYRTNAKVREHTSEVVEFAICMPGKGHGENVLLPIDSKFPNETYERLQQSSEAGDDAGVRELRKLLQTQIRLCAKEISSKYINPPVTTDFAILFLPTEGLYAEVLRQPGLFEAIQREFKVTISGPTTLSAILNALQMGFRSLAIEKRSSEVWQVLGAVQQEFKSYNDVVDRLGKQLTTAANSVGALQTRTNVMTRKLRSVESLPADVNAAALLGLEDEPELLPLPPAANEA